MITGKHISTAAKVRDGVSRAPLARRNAMSHASKRICLALIAGALLTACQPAPAPGPAGSNYSVLARDDAFTRTLDAGGTIALYDVTANQLLVRLQVSPKSKVKVGPDAGVKVNDNAVIPGPLPRDHQYELRIEN